MRLTSQIWIAALTRRIFADGGFAAVEARGAGEAGAIFIRLRSRNGSNSLFGPAPQSMIEADQPEDRLFEIRVDAGDDETVNAVIARERKFDPDLWVVEIETDNPERYIALMPA